MIKRVTSLLLVVSLCVSCQKFGEGRQMFRELLALRDQLMTEFHEKVVDVNVANDRMTIKFIDSPMSSRTREEKQHRADAVATFVAEHYKHPLSSVSIQFVGGGGTYVGRPEVPR